jgi:hypothetical protein
LPKDTPERPKGGDAPDKPKDDLRPFNERNAEPGTPERQRQIEEAEGHRQHTESGASYHTEPNLQDLARRVPDDGVHHSVDVHAFPDGKVRIGDHSLTADELADLIRRDPNWDGKPIRLLSCHSGDSGLAGKLANELGVPVTAPRGLAWTDSNGRVFASDMRPDGGPGWPPNGGWETHHPDGTKTPASDDGFHPSHHGEDPGERPDDAAERGEGQTPEHDAEGRQIRHIRRDDELSPHRGERFGDEAQLEPHSRYVVTDRDGNERGHFMTDENGNVSEVQIPKEHALSPGPNDQFARDTRVDQNGNRTSTPRHLEPDRKYTVFESGESGVKRGEFHTDDNGKINEVHTDRGKKHDWNPDLRRPVLTDATIHVRDRPFGEPDSNSYTYRTDSQGRTVSAEGNLRLTGSDDDYRMGTDQKETGHEGRDYYNDRTQRTVYETSQWDGGHLFGTQFGGAGEYVNMVPMLRSLNQNRGTSLADNFFKLETHLKEQLEAGKQVSVRMVVEYDPTTEMPTQLVVDYKVDGVPQRETYENVPPRRRR